MSNEMSNYERAQALAHVGTGVGDTYAMLAVADELRALREALQPPQMEVHIDPRAARGIDPTATLAGVQRSLERRGW